MLTNTIIYLKTIKTLFSSKRIVHNQYNFLNKKKQIVLNKPNSLLN